MTLSDIDDMLNTTLEPVKQRWPGRLAIEELHAPIPVTPARRIIKWSV